MIDEDALEAAFWSFDDERTRTGAERDAFKHKVRALLRAHMSPLLAALEETDLYVTAYRTSHEPPGGWERAIRVGKRNLGLLEDSRRQGGGRD
jgi:hypothetical protein